MHLDERGAVGDWLGAATAKSLAAICRGKEEASASSAIVFGSVLIAHSRSSSITLQDRPLSISTLHDTRKTGMAITRLNLASAASQGPRW